MSGFTITGGVSFSGAVSMSDAPPPVPENTATWFGGGYATGQQGGYWYSTVNRVTYATDTATASTRGPLSVAKRDLAAASNTTYSWFGGGLLGPSSYARQATVERITYATDTAATSTRGPLSLARQSLVAAGNTTDGWFAGGAVGAPTYATQSLVDRITYATDTATASVRGPLNTTQSDIAAAGNTTDGWFGSGPIARITYATDTATASVRGSLSSTRGALAAAGNTTDGWFGGGGGYTTIVDRITYATDTATASVRGPLSAGRYTFAAAGNTTDGWFGGGHAGVPLSRVDRITYATDTNTASVRGPLSFARMQHTAAAGIQ